MDYSARAWAWLLFVVTGSYSSPPQQCLVNALGGKGNCLLDSSQIQTVFAYMQHFPNESELSITILAGDSTSFVGVKRHNNVVILWRVCCIYAAAAGETLTPKAEPTR